MKPIIDRERQARPLQNVQVYLRFSEQRLPRKGKREAVAQELVRVVEAVACHPAFRPQDTVVEFAPRTTIAAVRSQMDEVMLPAEDWPLSAHCLASLSVSRRHVLAWPPWNCQNDTTAWLGPDVEELHRILEGKAEKAQEYDLGSRPLWLLVVCEVVGDLQSHIFPRNEGELTQLVIAVEDTGFDFQKGPFSEVWLFSSFGGERLRLHPLRRLHA